MTLVERAPATGLLLPSQSEMRPFSVMTSDSVEFKARETHGFYGMRWVTSVQLGASVILALIKRGGFNQLLFVDTYQDLKLEIFIFALQITSLIIYA